MRENNCCPAKLHRDLGSVAILFGCSVFLLHKSVKLDVFGVVGSRRNFYSKHRKGVPFPYFCPPGRSEIACWEVSQTLYENGKERKTMNGRKRTVQVKFYVTEEERKLIEEKMKLVPTSNMAAYLRKIAIDGYIIQVDHTDIKAMTAEIQKIGVNVNQIARRVNATGNAYKEDIDEIKGVLAEIWRLQRLSLLKAL